MAKEKDAAQLALEKLIPQQRKFVLAYCDSFNASKAAEEAKYSKKTARQQGSRLLTIVDIKTAIKEVLAKSAMDPEEIVARWVRIARAGLQDFMTKVEVEEIPKVAQHLSLAIEAIKEEIDYEYEFMVRSWEVLGTSEEDQGKELLTHEEWVKRRKLDILRHKMALDRDPNAFRLINGKPVKKFRMVLDLVKAEELGMLDLIKTHKVTGDGTESISLKDSEAVLENLAKHNGMLTSKVDLTSGGEQIKGFQLVDFDGSPLPNIQ